jgi:peptidoglycan/xylan/chitin deacetylase (PgdA/CDA1 family)
VTRTVRFIKRIVSRTRMRFKAGVVILAYHRVACLPDYAYPIVVTPDNFAQQMKVIQKHFYPMSLLELAGAIQRQRLPNRGVVVTFDDGYADVYANASPILKELQIPATIFVTTGNIDSQREFWWDELERIFSLPNCLPDKLQITLAGKQFEWALSTLPDRGKVRREIHRVLRPLSCDERAMAIKMLTKWADISEVGRDHYRTMTSAELIEVSQSGLIDLGGHTVSHPMLSALSPEEQEVEIVNGRKRLEAIIGRQQQTFSYPYGSSGDYDHNTVDIVRSAGFTAACTTCEATVRYGVDNYNLPRYGVGDWGADFFRSRLEHWFNQ